jgi:hypothetical protein
MAEKTYTGATLEQALKDGSLTRPGSVLVGMVKASQKGGHVCFTKSGCDSWVDLPDDLIECAEHVGQRACKDHAHPVMKITLKEPKDPVAQIYSALLAQPASAQAGPMPAQGWPSSVPQGYPVIQGGGVYGSPLMSVRGNGRTTASPASSIPRMSTRLGGGGFPGGGGINAWGCWDSCCESTCKAGHYEEGQIGTVWVCDWWECTDPCQRCIWPW